MPKGQITEQYILPHKKVITESIINKITAVIEKSVITLCNTGKICILNILIG